MTYKQMQLIRRTAWMNLQILDRGPSEADARYVPAAVKMLTLVACMGYAVLDLEEALAEAGKLRHIVKQRMNQIRRLTEYAHGTAFNMLRTVNPMAARQYNDQLDWMYGRISGRYNFNPAKPLVRIPALLECTGIEDCKIDGIIELNLTD